MASGTFAQMQGSYPTLYVDGTTVEDDDVRESLYDEEGARVQVEWDAIANGYISAGYVCPVCREHVEETPRELFRHLRDDHETTPGDAVGEYGEPETWRVDALANSAAIDWTGDDLTVTISTGDPRGAFYMTVRRMADGTRLLHVPHPDNQQHETLTELHPGTYRIG